MDIEKAGKGFWAVLAKLFNKDLAELIGKLPEFKALMDAAERLTVYKKGEIVISLSGEDEEAYEIGIGFNYGTEGNTEIIGSFKIPKKKEE